MQEGVGSIRKGWMAGGTGMEEVRQGRRKRGRADEGGREGGRTRCRAEEDRLGPSNEAEEKRVQLE